MFIKKYSRYLCLAFILTLLGSNSALYSQDVRASLTGLITDQLGANVQDADVSVTNVETKVVFSTKTNDVGSYTILFLLPGRYMVDVKANGFKQFRAENVGLSTSEHGTLDVKLEVGQLSESVEVSAEAPLLETTTASRGNVVNAQQIMDLPTSSRNIFNTILAAPGVTKQDSGFEQFSAYGLINSTRISINGGVARANETVLDGVVDTQPDGTVTFQPQLEAIEEVNVQTSNYDSSYGRFGGGVTAINTKAGTNSIHGSLFAYHVNSALAANAWSRNFTGQPKPSYRQNQFGFEVDAPIIIPKVFDGRNKLFFMLSYEGQRVNDSGGATAIIPTDAMKAGDFSQVPRVIYDPLSTHMVDGQAIRTPFPGNQIAASRINPVSKNLVEYLPSPNLAAQGYGIANYVSSVGGVSNYDMFLGRLDYRINEKNTLFYTGGRLPYLETDGILYPNSPVDPSGENPLHRNFDRQVIDWTNTLNPTTVFDLRAGYTRYASISGNPLAIGFDNTTLGMDPVLISQQRLQQFPRFNIGGFYAPMGSTSPLNTGVADTQSYQANLSKSLDRHQMKFGGEVRIYNQNTLSSGYGGGLYEFTKGFTQENPLVSNSLYGDEFASFLLGYPDSGQVDLTIDPSYQGLYYTVFGQDDFRLNDRISINFGLRWDYERPTEERYNRMVSGFAFDQASPLASAIPGLKGGLLYADSSNRYAFNPDRNNIQPRIGAAIRLTKDWVLRGGYGLYYLATFGGQPTTGYSATTPLVSSADGGLTPLVSLTNGFPSGLDRPIGSSMGLSTNLGQVVSFNDPERGTPWSHQVSVGLQHVFRSTIVAEASYSGNFTRDYPVSVNLNAIPKDQLGKAASYYTQQVANPFEGLLPLNPARNGATVPRQNLLVPFPQFTTVTMNNIPIGKNDFHSLQTRLVMRNKHGMTMQLGYVWSKTLEQMSFLNPQDLNLQDIHASKLEKRLSQFDVPHRFTALWTYQLPFGHNRLIGGNLHGFVDKLVSGWQINVNATIQSGFPAPFPNAPNMEARSAKLPSDQQTLFNAFDTSLFPTSAPNLQYTYRTWPTRFPDVRLKALTNMDLGISKKTAITERLRFELRAEAYDATNTPWFNTLNSQGADVSSSQFGWFNLSSAANRSITLIGKLIW